MALEQLTSHMGKDKILIIPHTDKFHIDKSSQCEKWKYANNKRKYEWISLQPKSGKTSVTII